MSAQKYSIIYIGDPMCSWCYGISGEILELKKNNPQLNFELIVGGLRPGGGDEWNAKFTNFLKHHWEEVSERSGQEFKYDLLSDPYFNYDTEPACRSIVSMKELAPEKVFDFFHLVQKGFYFENRDPKELAFYKPICANLEISYKDFVDQFESEEAKTLTTKEFTMARSLGVQSFPTVLLEMNGKHHIIANGYQTYERMQESITRYLSQK